MMADGPSIVGLVWAEPPRQSTDDEPNRESSEGQGHSGLQE